MSRFNQLNRAQLNERASNKLEAQLFFAHKELQEIELEIEGVIPSTLDNDQLRKIHSSQRNEIQTLTYIFSLIENKY